MKPILKRLGFKCLFFLGPIGVLINLSRFSFKTSKSMSPYPLVFRKLIDASTPIDPLGGISSIPEIEMCIPCTEKDLALLRTVIHAAVTNSKNRINLIRIVVPALQVGIFQKYLGDDFNHLNLIIVSEADLLGDLIPLCASIAPASRRGWLIQQVVKFMCVLTSAEDGVLILDSDTVITQQRTWLGSDQAQILMISEEFHAPYQHHFIKFQASLKPEELPQGNPRVSFVTHHQLMQPAFLREMFGGDYMWRFGLETWIKAVNFAGDSPACEYHCYGSFMVTNNANRLHFARWGNIAVPRSDVRVSYQNLDLVKLRTEFPDSLSISMHSYLS